MNRNSSLALLFIITACGGGGGGGGEAPTPPTPAPGISFSATPTSVLLNNTSTFSWSTTNATSCTASGSNNWTGTKATSGTEDVSIDIAGNTVFTLSCSGAGGTRNASVTVEGYRQTDGVVVDGYISGADVFIDENANFIADASENATTSDNDGKFTIKYANGSLVSIGGTDLDSQTLLDNLLITHKLDGHSDFKAITPVTSVDAFLESVNVNAALGIDSSIDVGIADPVALKGDGGIYDYLYEKGNQLTVLAYALQNITNDLNTTTETTQDFFRSIAEEVETEYVQTQNKVDIETTDFISRVLSNVEAAKALSLNETYKSNTVTALASVIPIIQVKDNADTTTSLIRFGVSQLQEDIVSLANGSASDELVEDYTEDVINYIATTESISSDNLTPDISSIDDSASVDEDAAVDIFILNNDSFVAGAPFDISTTMPMNGDVEIINNYIIYTPDADYFGDDDFSYTLSQGDKTASADVSVEINSINDAPSIDIASTLTVAENQTAITTVSISDVDEDNLTLTLGGTDADSLNLSTENVLSFKEAPDYETKDNYEINLSLTDGTETVEKDISILITDLNDVAPIFTSSPSFSAPENQLAIGTVAASDEEDDELSFSISGEELAITAEGVLTFISAPDFETKSSYSAVVTVSDGINEATQDIAVNVTNVNDVAPVFTSSATFSAAENQTAIGTVTATDAEGDDVTFTITGDELAVTSAGILTFISAPDFETKNKYTETVTVSDGVNSSSQSITVNVLDVDEIPPVISINGDNPVTIELGSTYTDAGAVADGGETVSLESNIDTAKVGSYTVTYFATDAAGNTGTATRVVNVVDTTAPTVTVIGDNPATSELGSTYTDAGATASDLSGEVSVTTSGSVDINTIGSYTLTYSATDASGNTGTATRVVIVQDTTGPQITILGDNPETVELVYYDPPNSVYKDTAGAISDGGEEIITDDSFVDNTVIGTYFVFYSATDSSGNKSTVARTVYVVDTTAPRVRLLSNGLASEEVTIELGSTFVDSGAYGYDASKCTGQLSECVIEVTTSGTVDTSTVGTYTLTYSATDASGNTGTATKTVNVVDTTAPVFTSSATFSAAENQTAIGTVSATDLSGNILFSIASDEIEITTDGVLSFVLEPDYETKSSYSATVTVTDGANSATQDITVTITNVNDTAPAFTSDATFTAAENQTAIGTVTATDADGDGIIFSITGTEIAIDSSSGKMSFISTPDYETKSTYTATIAASDGVYSTTQDITVNISNVNDIAPVFTSDSIFTVEENQTTIGTVTATDAEGDDITFSISESELTITSSGVLTFASAPDYETKSTYTAIVSASDGANTTNQNITVNITNLNESPVLSSNAISLNEGITEIASNVLNVSDPESDEFSVSIKPNYSFIVGGSANGSTNPGYANDYDDITNYKTFGSSDGSTFIVTSDTTLSGNYKITSNIQLADGVTLTLSFGIFWGDEDGLGSNWRDYTRIEVLNGSLVTTWAKMRNLNIGYFNLTKQGSIQLSRSSCINCLMGVQDGNTNAGSLLINRSYLENVSNGSWMSFNYPPATFNIQNSILYNSGQISVSASSSRSNPLIIHDNIFAHADDSTLDFPGGLNKYPGKDNDDRAYINYFASNNIRLSSQNNRYLNSEIPVFYGNDDIYSENDYFGSSGLLENRHYNSSDNVTYQDINITNPVAAHTAETQIKLQPRLKYINDQFVLDFSPDYEARQTSLSYIIDITDNDGVVTSNELTISILNTNEAPLITTNSSFNVQENTLSISDLNAIDPEGDDITFSVSGSELEISAEGVLTFIEAPDYESKTTYSATVSASDGVNSTNQDITINIIDVDEVEANDPELSNITFSTNNVDVTDESKDVTVTLNAKDVSGISLATSGDPSPRFVLGTTRYSGTWSLISGNIYDGTYQTTITIPNTAVPSSYLFYTGRFNDKWGNTADVNVSDALEVVNGNTEAEDPELSNITFSTNNVDVTDESKDVTVTLNAKDVSGISLATSGDPSPRFVLGTTRYSGTWSLISGNIYDGTYQTTITIPNTAVPSSYLFYTGRFNDKWGNTADVNVSDALVVYANINSPSFTSEATFSAAENQTAIGTVTATDSDGDTITYSISGSEITINPSSGVIAFASAPDYETKSTYTATVTASDGTNSATQDITVNVTNVNDIAPEFTSNATFSAGENQTSIGTVTATDADGDGIVYSISGSDITINSSTGFITFTTAPDYETKTTYTAEVTASDGANSATQDITVNVTNVNDIAPVFTSANNFSVVEGQTAIGTVTATDAEGDDVTFTVSGTELTITSGGVLTFVSAPDYETKSSYTATVTASDGVNTSNQNITIDVTFNYEYPDHWDQHQANLNKIKDVYTNPIGFNLDKVWFTTFNINKDKFSTTRFDYFLEDPYFQGNVGVNTWFTEGDATYYFNCNWVPQVPSEGATKIFKYVNGEFNKLIYQKNEGCNHPFSIKNKDGSFQHIFLGLDEGKLGTGSQALGDTYTFNTQSGEFTNLNFSIGSHGQHVFDYQQDGDEDIISNDFGKIVASGNPFILRNDGENNFSVVMVPQPDFIETGRLRYSTMSAAAFYESGYLKVVYTDFDVSKELDNRWGIEAEKNVIVTYEPNNLTVVDVTQLPDPYSEENFVNLEYYNQSWIGSNGLSHDVRSTPIDIDYDGDIDIVIGSQVYGENISLPQILINNNGVFEDQTESRLFNWVFATGSIHRWDFADVNGDGYLDIITKDGCNNLLESSDGELIAIRPNGCELKVAVNDGTGHFISIIEPTHILQIFEGNEFKTGRILPIFGMDQNRNLSWVYADGMECNGCYNEGNHEIFTVKLDGILSTGPNGMDPAIRGEPGFNEFYYLLHHADARDAVSSGQYDNGLEHYIAVGKDLGYSPNAKSSTNVTVDSYSINPVHTVKSKYVNLVPSITSSATFSAAENQTAIGTVTVTDAEGDDVTFTVSGTELAITSAGVLTFASAPDYETKTSYTATVTASDGTNSTTQSITVNVTDVNEAPNS